jgi:hypothetical protein
VLWHELALRARAERQQRQRQEWQLARQRRRQQYRAAQLPSVNRLSKRWKAGATLRDLAKVYGVSIQCVAARIRLGRALYPEKFPRRFASMTPAWHRGIERLWRRYWQAQLPAINQLSRQWKSGVAVDILARAQGRDRAAMQERIRELRKRFPKKFPRRFPPPAVAGVL